MQTYTERQCAITAKIKGFESIADQKVSMVEIKELVDGGAITWEEVTAYLDRMFDLFSND